MTALQQAYNALMVVLKNPTIRAFLGKSDPKTLEQVQKAAKRIEEVVEEEKET